MDNKLGLVALHYSGDEFQDVFPDSNTLNSHRRLGRLLHQAVALFVKQNPAVPNAPAGQLSGFLTATRKIESVSIIEDAKGVREQLAQVTNSVPDIRCLGAFASGEETLAAILKIEPGLVLMDIGLPRMSGI